MASDFNITFLAGPCSDNVIGDIEAPLYGQMVTNATLLWLYQPLRGLTPEQLCNYTITMMQVELDSMYDTLDVIICDPPSGGSRVLLQRYLPQDMTGRCSVILLRQLGPFAQGVSSLLGALGHVGLLADISPLDNVFVVVSATIFAALWNRGIDYLQERGKVQMLEAFVWKNFIAAGEQIRLHMLAIWSMTCTTTAIVRENIGNLCDCCASNNPQVAAPPEDDKAGGEAPQQVRVGGFC